MSEDRVMSQIELMKTLVAGVDTIVDASESRCLANVEYCTVHKAGLVEDILEARRQRDTAQAEIASLRAQLATARKDALIYAADKSQAHNGWCDCHVFMRALARDGK